MLWTRRTKEEIEQITDPNLKQSYLEIDRFFGEEPEVDSETNEDGPEPITDIQTF